jgi:hypothetical protein
MTGIEVKGVLGAILVAFGIAVPLPAFLAGMALALGGAFFAMMGAGASPSTRAVYATTIFLAIVAGFLAALLHPLVKPEWPVQLFMMIGGGLSKYLAETLAQAGSALRDRAVDAARNFKIPWLKRKGDGDV